MLSWLLIILVVILLIAALPRYPYSRSWGHTPSGILGTILIILLVLILLDML